jgi:Leucine-rich repeat (LRR) protein
MAAVITSIIGLQNLTNLQNFNADYNGLTSINLSNLPNLTYLDISDCDIPGTNTSSLTSVNLSGCTALQELRLDDSNFSGGIPNLSGLDSLIYMDFDQSGITGSVDISNLPVLEGFDFSGNTGLTELIISDAQPLGGNGYELLVYNCALTQTAVDNILVALSESAVTNGYVDLSGGNNASPSQTGIDAANVLNDKSWSFDYDVTAINYTVSNLSSPTRDCELFPNLGLYSLQSDPLEVVRFYNNSNLTSPFLGTADAFFTFVLFDQPENVYTANIDPVTGDVSNIQLCS